MSWSKSPYVSPVRGRPPPAAVSLPFASKVQPLVDVWFAAL
ncbi:hypothetical protein [Streptomyces sp. SID3343]|nr:hypothetical protein [Streptomyces sp. SID3343]